MTDGHRYFDAHLFIRKRLYVKLSYYLEANAPFDIPFKYMVDLEKLKEEVFSILRESLPKQLNYHTVKHTQDVFNVSHHISSLYRIPEQEQTLLLISALFHDIGFIHTYKGHEEKSVELCRQILEPYNLRPADLKAIDGMIKTTKIPQAPTTFLEKIICDADLDYLGRDDFYSTGSLLFEEYLSYGFVNSEKEFDDIQIRFLENHRYHTGYSKLARGFRKMNYLKELKAKSYQTT
jgi:hypothetical protein